MDTLIFDNSWTGFLSAIFELYDRRLYGALVVSEKDFQPDFFGRSYLVVTDKEKAARVWKGLSAKISAGARKRLYSCYLSEIAGIAQAMAEYVRLAFDAGESPEHQYQNQSVLRVTQVDRMVHREKHRMEAFIRFSLTTDGLYYAVIEPDFNVLPLIVKHFKNRYADQRWLIYDLKRKYGVYYDLEKVEEVTFGVERTPENTPSAVFVEDEALYQHLWQDYFKNVNIKERKNNKLHVQHVPKRYWKYLTEKMTG